MVIRHLCHPKMASPMERIHNIWSSATFVTQRRQVRCHVERTYGHPPPLSSRDNKSDDTWRKHMVICHLCHLETTSLMTCRDDIWPSATFVTQRRLVRWHMETTYGHLPPLSSRDGKSDDTKQLRWPSTPFVEDTMSMDRDYFSLSLRHLEDGMSDDMQRPICSSTPFVEDLMFINRDYFSLPSSSRDGKFNDT